MHKTDDLFASRYEDLSLLGKGSLSRVYRARDRETNTWIALKVLDGDIQRGSQENLAHFQHETETLAALDNQHIVRLLDSGNFEGTFFLALEYLQGKTLKSWMIKQGKAVKDISFPLAVIRQIAEGLSDAHKRGILHRDIKPSNIMILENNGGNHKGDGSETVCPDGRAKILDFSIARLVDFARFLSHQKILSSFYYMSPEQAGLLKQPIDARADLYSLGVLSYELLCGRLPYQGGDPASLLHEHLTRTADPPSRRNPAVPEDLSRIVEQLMAKLPEERYPTADGLLDDLQAVQEGMGRTQICVSLPGSFPSEPPRKNVPLLERDEELTFLEGIFLGAKRNHGSLLLIEGEAGVGKTRLVEEFRKRAERKGALFLYSKCDEHRHRVPYQPFQKALEHLSETFRAWPGEKRKRFEKRILGSLKEPGAVLQELAPEWKTLFPFLPSVPELDPEKARERLQEALARFFSHIGDAKSPLVLILDDLQWAEEESVHTLFRIVEELLRKPFFTIGLYREEDVDSKAHLLRLRRLARERPGRVSLLRLPPLRPEGVRTLVCEALEIHGQGYRALYEEVFRASQGNPFFIQEILQALAEKKVLLKNPLNGSWSYDSEGLGHAALSTNVIDLILRRIQSLSKETRRILSLCSALGAGFRFEHLLPLSGMTEKELLDHLDVCVHMQFLREAETEEERTLYQFVHDRIREAINTRIPESEKKEIHRRIGEQLEIGTDQTKGQGVFDLAHHFLLAEDPARALPYLIKAGDRARVQAAHREAVHYYEEALKTLDVNDPRFGPLHEHLGDLYSILGEYGKALDSYGKIRDRQGTGLAGAAWNRKVGTVHCKRGDFSNAIKHLEEALILLHKKPIRSRAHHLLPILFLSFLRSLSLPHPFRFLNRRRDSKESTSRFAELARIYREFAHLYLFLDVTKGLVAHLQRFRYSMLSNDLSMQADVLRDHAGYLTLRKRFNKSRNYLEKSMDLCSRLGDYWGIAKAESYLSICEFLQGDLEPSAQRMERAIPKLEQAGDRFEMEHSYAHLAITYLTLGEVDKALECFENVRKVTTDQQNARGELIFHTGLGWVCALKGDMEKAEAHFGAARQRCEDSKYSFFKASFYSMFGLYLTLKEEFDPAIEALEEAEKEITRNRLYTYHMASCLLMLPGTYLKKASQVSQRAEKKRWLKKARRSYWKGRFVAFRFPVFSGLGWVVRGLYWSAKEKHCRAQRAFLKGIHVLEKHKAYSFLALGFEEYAVHLAGVNDPQYRSYQDRAKQIYREKGLSTDYRRMLRRFGEADHTEGRGEKRGEPAGILQEPLLSPEVRVSTSILEASRLITATLDLKDVLKRIVDLSVQSLGALRGLLLMHEAYLPSEAASPPVDWVPDSTLRVLVARNMEPAAVNSELFSRNRRVIRDVFKSHEPVILSDHVRDPRLRMQEDSADAESASILCVPLMDNSHLAGILYLDNQQVSNLFTRQDLSFLQSLALFSVIAIHNAQAFEQLGRQRDEISQLKEKLQEEIVYLKEEIQTEFNFEEIVGSGTAIQKVFRFIDKAAPLDLPVLILGETGTGKELVARAIHRCSQRNQRPFVKVNCAALPPDLLESELFGHEKGAFTGATRKKPGRFELADKGTLFLDEIGEMPPSLQSKLLQVLQDMEFERVGGTRSVRVDVRILAATNRNLEQEVQNETFRADLYYRLHVLPVTVPPLRERKEDIPLLVTHFVERLNREFNKQVTGLDRESMETIQEYPWPGNVRELKNLLERAMALSSGPYLELTAHLFPEKASGIHPVQFPESGTDLPLLDGNYYKAVDEFKRRLIQESLRMAGGTKKKAARLLGIDPSYFSRLFKTLQIEDE